MKLVKISCGWVDGSVYVARCFLPSIGVCVSVGVWEMNGVLGHDSELDNLGE